MKIHLTGEYESFRVCLNGEELFPTNECPDGFAWGYVGMGPEQLAMALCMALYGHEDWWPMKCQEFMTKYIVPLPSSDFDVFLDVPDKLKVKDKLV